MQALRTLRLPPRLTALPGGCWICRSWGWQRLCADCTRRWAAPIARCPRCALRLAGASAVCAACQREPLPLDGARAAFDFAPPWDSLLHALKYEQALGLAPALAALWPAPPADALLLAVPLHAARLAERGHNQSLLLAQALARQHGLPAPPREALRRVIDTPSQTKLNRSARLANLRQAFALQPGFSVQGRPCLLIDDVMTTGATLATLATLLRRHGAARVDAWVLARTPDPAEPS